jgi:hypothetical protein
MFEAKKLPPRDERGYTRHPDIGELNPRKNIRVALHDAGFDMRTVSMEFDAGEALYRRHFVRGEHCAGEWTPTPPGAEWRLVAVLDGHEDGPHALFIRRADPRTQFRPEEEPARRQGPHARSTDRCGQGPAYLGHGCHLNTDALAARGGGKAMEFIGGHI